MQEGPAIVVFYHCKIRSKDAGATKIAATLDKLPQSKQSGRSGSNRIF
jgi:hypothetical protein